MWRWARWGASWRSSRTPASRRWWAETLFLCDLALVAVLQIPQAPLGSRPTALLPLAFCVNVLVWPQGLPLALTTPEEKHTNFSSSRRSRPKIGKLTNAYHMSWALAAFSFNCLRLASHLAQQHAH